MEKPELAIFDLDGTLIQHDSYVPFLTLWLKHHPERVAHALILPMVGWYYKLAAKDRDYIKEKFLIACMQGTRRTELAWFARRFWQRFLKRRANIPMIERLRAYHQDGVPVWIVTASFEFYVEPIRRFVPVAKVLGTQARWNEEYLAGTIVGKTCRGEEKIRRIEQAWGTPIDRLVYHAFSDNQSDRLLLEHARYSIFIAGSRASRYDVVDQ